MARRGVAGPGGGRLRRSGTGAPGTAHRARARPQQEGGTAPDQVRHSAAASDVRRIHLYRDGRGLAHLPEVGRNAWRDAVPTATSSLRCGKSTGCTTTSSPCCRYNSSSGTTLRLKIENYDNNGTALLPGPPQGDDAGG